MVRKGSRVEVRIKPRQSPMYFPKFRTKSLRDEWNLPRAKDHPGVRKGVTHTVLQTLISSPWSHTSFWFLFLMIHKKKKNLLTSLLRSISGFNKYAEFLKKRIVFRALWRKHLYMNAIHHYYRISLQPNEMNPVHSRNTVFTWVPSNSPDTIST